MKPKVRPRNPTQADHDIMSPRGTAQELDPEGTAVDELEVAELLVVVEGTFFVRVDPEAALEVIVLVGLIVVDE